MPKPHVLTRELIYPYKDMRAHVVRGPRGVISLTWTKSKSPAEKRSIDSFLVFDGIWWASDLGYHKIKRPRRWSWFGRNEHCEFTGTTCWYDGTSLGAEELARLYLEQGEDALYAELEDIYRSRWENR